VENRVFTKGLIGWFQQDVLHGGGDMLTVSAAMSPKWDLGQWLCAPLFRAVCPFPTAYISAGMNMNFSKKRSFIEKKEIMKEDG